MKVASGRWVVLIFFRKALFFFEGCFFYFSKLNLQAQRFQSVAIKVLRAEGRDLTVVWLSVARSAVGKAPLECLLVEQQPDWQQDVRKSLRPSKKSASASRLQKLVCHFFPTFLWILFFCFQSECYANYLLIAVTAIYTVPDMRVTQQFPVRSRTKTVPFKRCLILCLISSSKRSRFTFYFEKNKNL